MSLNQCVAANLLFLSVSCAALLGRVMFLGGCGRETNVADIGHALKAGYIIDADQGVSNAFPGSNHTGAGQGVVCLSTSPMDSLFGYILYI